MERRRVKLLGAASGVALVAAGLAGASLVSHLTRGSPAAAEDRPATQPVPPIVSAARLAQTKGVRIVHVAVSGAGGLGDLRFLVLDADWAAGVHAAAPVMVDERTGAVVDQLLMGHSHKGALRAGQTYYLIFENPGNLVRRGGRVTVALGGARVRHVRVE
jgi:hypothetical protein